MSREQPDEGFAQGFGVPDMVVGSVEGSRWGQLGLRLSQEQREIAVDSLTLRLKGNPAAT